MTSIYFVRHAEPEHDWENDRTRPLTTEGLEDCKKVTEALRNINADCYFSSPYLRSFGTIKESAGVHGIDIITDERFREREKGPEGNAFGMFQKRWSDFDFHEEGGESLNMVQKRNIEALFEVLKSNKGKNIVIGTHGTALCTILNYFYPSFCCDDFLRIIDYMPYIIRLDFEGSNYIGKEELLIINKEFKGCNRADKNKVRSYNVRIRTLSGAFLIYGNDYLMMKRSENKRIAPGMWGGVGGHVESDEFNNPKSACLREIYEESAIEEKDMENLNLRYIVLRRDIAEITLIYYFIGDSKTKDFVDKTQEGKLFWVKERDLLNRPLSFEIRNLLEHYLHVGRKSDDIFTGTVSVSDKLPQMNWSTLDAWEGITGIEK